MLIIIIMWFLIKHLLQQKPFQATVQYITYPKHTHTHTHQKLWLTRWLTQASGQPSNHAPPPPCLLITDSIILRAAGIAQRRLYLVMSTHKHLRYFNYVSCFAQSSLLMRNVDDVLYWLPVTALLWRRRVYKQRQITSRQDKWRQYTYNTQDSQNIVTQTLWRQQ